MGRYRMLRETLDVWPRDPRDAATLIGLVVAYVAAGLFSQQLNSVGHGLAVMWFPSGLAAFLIRRPGRWPAIFVGSILADAAVGTPPLSLVFIGIGNSLEALVAAALLRTAAAPDLSATGLRGFQRLAFASVLAPVASVVLGLVGLLLTGTIVEAAGLPSAAVRWWLSDMLGIILVAPAILAWQAGRYVVAQRDGPWTRAGVVLALSAIAGVFFSDVLSGSALAASRAYVGLPVLAFVAIRYGAGAVSAVLAVGGAFVASLLAVGQGPFYSSDPVVASTSLGVYVLVMAATGHGLAAALREREAAAAAIRRAEAEQRRLATAIDQAADSVILTDRHGVIEYVNPAFERAFGYAADEVVDRRASDMIRSGVHPDAFYAGVDAAIARGEVWTGTIVDRRKDGSFFELDASISPMRDLDGTHIGAVSVGRDRSHERQLEADLALEADVHIALGRALQALPAMASAPQAAQVLCDALWQLPRVSFVAVFGFSGADQVTALGLRATAGFPSEPIGAGRRAHELRERAATGPWAEAWRPIGEDAAWGRALTARRLKAAAYGPIVHGDHVDGLLMIGTTDEPFARVMIDRLPMVVDFTSTPIALLADRLHDWRERAETHDALQRILDEGSFSAVFQPIVDLASGETVGFEALTRFDSGLEPTAAFHDAWRVGLGFEVELATLGAAVEAARSLPAGVWLDLNVAPRLFEAPDRLAATLRRVDRPLVLEITEHEAITDYAAIHDAVDRLGLDVRLAVDDAGAGIANFSHIVELRPALVKLDSGLVQGVNVSTGRQALVVAMRHFARTAGCRLVAEGIETAEEAATLSSLGVEFGQGYWLGAPAPAAAWTMPRPAG